RRRPGVSLGGVSAGQSADGPLVPGGLDALASAAAAHGSLTYVDASQAVGWVPFDAGRFDFVSCPAYKWLRSPRGTAFGVVRPERLEMLRPLHAGWYAGADPWTSIYGPPLRLAREARRLHNPPPWCGGARERGRSAGGWGAGGAGARGGWGGGGEFRPSSGGPPREA